MRISDWSSDVCSSDLLGESLEIELDAQLALGIRPGFGLLDAGHALQCVLQILCRIFQRAVRQVVGDQGVLHDVDVAGVVLVDFDAGNARRQLAAQSIYFTGQRSEERRVGEECGSNGRYRWVP